MIYFRNNPSILFWEAGGTVITPEHMQQMTALQKQWDPYGQRVVGSRDSSDAAEIKSLTPISGYYRVMIAQDPRTEQLNQPTDLFRGFSPRRRDRAPIIEVEDFREEGARRMWDDYSPPYYKAKKGPTTPGWRTPTISSPRRASPSPDRALLGVLGEPHLQPRPRPLPLVRLRIDLLLGLRRRWPPGLKRGGAGQRQGRRRAPAQGDLLRAPRDAERAARPAHPRPLDLSRRPTRRDEDGKDHLRHRQHRVGRTLRQRQVCRSELKAHQWMDILLAANRVRTRHHARRRQERRKGRRRTGHLHGRRTRRYQAHRRSPARTVYRPTRKTQCSSM
jgi:hypothetical protein